jgi:hypothetical protein
MKPMNALIHTAQITRSSGRSQDCFAVTVDGKPVAAINAQGHTVLSGGNETVTYSPSGSDNLNGWDAKEIAEDFVQMTLPKLSKWMVV